jgi:predicted dehydrogenase
MTSFDVWAHSLPPIEVYGTEGTLRLADPNTFDGTISLWTVETRAWKDIAPVRDTRANWRGVGLADMAENLRSGRPHRASGELGYHILDLMHEILDDSAGIRRAPVGSTVDRPAPLSDGVDTYLAIPGRTTGTATVVGTE